MSTTNISFSMNHFMDLNINNELKKINSESSSNTDSDNTDAISNDSDNNNSSMQNDSSDHHKEHDELFCTKTDGDEFSGEVLKNRYLLLKKLGYGAFSSVWMAYDVENNDLVAVKIINPQDFKDGMLELKIFTQLEKLNNTYILTMKDYFQVLPIHPKYESQEYKKKYNTNHNHIVIVLPLMACSTEDLIQCQDYENGLPISVCKEILLQTIMAVKELEKHGLMHTDLKPENILVCGLNKEEEILLDIIQDLNINELHKNKMTELIKDDADDSTKWICSYKIYKQVTKTIIKFIEKELIEIKNNMENCKISKKYIEHIKIKLCDFNLVIETEEKIGNTSVEIQTRYYRAPEIIIGSGLHTKTDYWSLACILFELLTGDMLFDPDKDDKHSRDIHHMYLIEELLGPTPKNMIRCAEKCDIIFDDKEHLKNVNAKVKRWNLKNVFSDNYNNLGLTQNIIDKIITLLESILKMNPDNRPSLKNIVLMIKNIPEE